ncbi:MAG: hypothetical protein ABJM43_04650 [Paracoccaceae bacterium]
MKKSYARTLLGTAAIALSAVAFPSQMHACMLFDEPDPAFWSEHATSIVEASIYAFETRPLNWGKKQDTSVSYPDPWVLKLHVHRTIRGNSVEFREVATRILNTTIVDATYISDLIGHRREFAILDAPNSWSLETNGMLPENNPPHLQDVYVVDAKGDPVGEIWELMCAALPIFEVGTFAE